MSPADVTLDGKVTVGESTEVETADTLWAYTWSPLPEYDKDGKKITYTVAETEYKIGENNYEDLIPANPDNTPAPNYDVSFTNELPTRDIEVVKAWSPADWPSEIESVTVGLYKTVNGTESPVTTGDPAAYWTITFNGESEDAARTFSSLPVYDANGTAIAYSVKEISVTPVGGTAQNVANDAVTVNGKTWTVSVGAVSDEGKATVTNTYTGISIKVTKVWTQGGSPKTTATSIDFELHQVLKAEGYDPINTVYRTGKVNYTNTEWEIVPIEDLPVTETRTVGEGEAQTNVTYTASYYVVETGATADAGYVLTTTYSNNGTNDPSATASEKAVDTDDATITIINTETAGVTLPSTGGLGTVIYTAVGLSLLLGASLWLMLRRRKEQQN